MGFSVVLSVDWRNSGNCNFRNQVKTGNFTEAKMIRNFWRPFLPVCFAWKLTRTAPPGEVWTPQPDQAPERTYAQKEEPHLRFQSCMGLLRSAPGQEANSIKTSQDINPSFPMSINAREFPFLSRTSFFINSITTIGKKVWKAKSYFL